MESMINRLTSWFGITCQVSFSDFKLRLRYVNGKICFILGFKRIQFLKLIVDIFVRSYLPYNISVLLTTEIKKNRNQINFPF